MKPSIGRMVHYVMPSGEHRPAVVVKVWNDVGVNLQVFTDGSNDGADVGNVEWKTSVCQDESMNKSAHTWHWPEHVS